MSREIGVELDETEIEQFLKQQGLGVLGFARENESYTIPVAFAYDDSAMRCIFRFLMTDDSRKQEFISQTERANLTAYNWQGANDWKSVVAGGPIQSIDDDDLGEAAALFSDIGEETALEVFNRPISEYETRWYELDITEVTGRGRFPEIKEQAD